MKAIRDTLLTTLDDLALAGRDADGLLVAEEARHAASSSTDEQPLQTLGALSRELWAAHKAVLTAIAATRQYERLEGR